MGEETVVDREHTYYTPTEVAAHNSAVCLPPLLLDHVAMRAPFPPLLSEGDGDQRLKGGEGGI